MDLRPLAKRLARLRLVDPERDLIERLDRLDVAGGGLRYAATSAPTPRAAQGLVAKLERALPELAHGLRVIADDRPKLVGRNVIGRALARVPAPLPLAFSWRRGDRAPPRAIPRVRVGPLLGYPPCCVRFEEARRAAIVRAEAEGMLETWRPGTVTEAVAAILERRPYLADDVGDDAARLARLRCFPFVSFVPCPDCCERGAKSPAGRDNERRRRLAGTISPAYARRIEARVLP